MPRSRTAWSIVAPGAYLVFAVSCGGSEASPESPADVREEQIQTQHQPSRMTAASEIGALDEHAVNETFSEALGDLRRCLREGSDRVEFLGGEIGFYLEIDSSGRISDAFAETTTLGDRETEKCMLDALRSRSWPAPQGGETGLARNSFDFDMLNDVRPPTPWDSDRVSEALTELSEQIAECKGGSGGTFTATMYVDTEGAPLAVGIAPPDEGGEASADCLAEVLKGGTYPSPGSWPAKVTFSL